MFYLFSLPAQFVSFSSFFDACTILYWGTSKPSSVWSRMAWLKTHQEGKNFNKQASFNQALLSCFCKAQICLCGISALWQLSLNLGECWMTTWSQTTYVESNPQTNLFLAYCPSSVWLGIVMSKCQHRVRRLWKMKWKRHFGCFCDISQSAQIAHVAELGFNCICKDSFPFTNSNALNKYVWSWKLCYWAICIQHDILRTIRHHPTETCCVVTGETNNTCILFMDDKHN